MGWRQYLVEELEKYHDPERYEYRQRIREIADGIKKLEEDHENPNKMRKMWHNV